MIKIDVFVKDKNWKKHISNPAKYLKDKVKFINSSILFNKKYINFSILLAGNKEIKILNNKFRKKNKITIDVENIGDLAHYSNLYKEDKKTTKIFTKCFKNKESYKELLKKLPKNIERTGLYYLITVYWIAYTCHYHNDKFDKAMEECLESIDEYVVLLNSTRFCKKVFCYLVEEFAEH